MDHRGRRIQVDAIFSGGELTIEGRIKEGKDLTDAIKASHQLVGYISKVYPSAPNQRVAYYSLGELVSDPQLV